MKSYFFLVLIFFLVSGNSSAQSNDFFTLRKRDKIIRTYFAGEHISFVTTSGAFRDAEITAIKHDSIYLQEFLIRKLPTTYGGYILDTAGSFRYKYNYREIQAFGKKQKGFDIGRSGIALFGGGSVLTIASLLVLAINKDKFSPLLFSAGLGGVILGYVLGKAANTPIVIGKKHYTIEYTNLQK